MKTVLEQRLEKKKKKNMAQKYLHTTGILGGKRAKCGERVRLTDPILQLEKKRKAKMLLSAESVAPVQCEKGGLNFLEAVSSY